MVGRNLLEVFEENLEAGRLPQNYSRAIFTLLLKKGGPPGHGNQRPVSLLCRAYKIHLKALTL